MRRERATASEPRERSGVGVPASEGVGVLEGRQPLELIKSFIDRNYAKQLTVAALARRARLSPFHFIRSFRAATGLTPHQYVRERRLERARHLLSTTPMPVTDVCQAVGFASLGSFSALFRRATGLSPIAFRASTRRPIYIPGCFVRMYRIGR